MSEGSVFQRKDGKWCGKYKGNDGKWKYLYRKTRGEAKQSLREALRDREAGITTTDQTVNDALESWLEDIQDEVSRRTWLNRESLYRCHIKSHAIGTKKLKAITPDDIRNFYKDKTKTLADSTVKRLHTMLNTALTQAVRRKQLRTNPITESKHRRLDVRIWTYSLPHS